MNVIIVENSLSILGNGYRNCAVVFDGDPDDGAAPRWECQAGESKDAFITRVEADFWEKRGALL